MKTAFCQQWEESEAGWGTRPDGYSLHASKEAAERFLKNYAAEQQAEYRKSGGRVPHEYSRPSGTMYECKVSDNIHAVLEASTEDGLYDGRLQSLGLVKDGRYPFPGSRDGWQSKNLAYLDQE